MHDPPAEAKADEDVPRVVCQCPWLDVLEPWPTFPGTDDGLVFYCPECTEREFGR